MTREQRIVETFVELADAMVEDFDVIDFLHRLAKHCAEMLDCVDAGLLLADPAGVLRVTASLSERSDALDLLQSQNEEGPCFDCYSRQTAVFSEDLAADIRRWPAFAPMAVQTGFRSVLAIPMRARGETVGALNLFRAETGALVEQDISLGQGMADIAAIALLQERVVREAHVVVEQLQGALTSRVIIEQAKGVLAERASIDVDDAFTRLRNYARKHNLRISDVARNLVEGRFDATNPTDPTLG